MYYETTEALTDVYQWNTAMGIELKHGEILSDHVDLEEEIDEATISKTYQRVCMENGVALVRPMLMMITTGNNAGCRVWVDLMDLKTNFHTRDPLESIDYYVTD